MSNSYPSLVYIIRHGEKLGASSSDKSGGPDLSIKGSARAAALPSLFVPATPPLSCPLTAGSQIFIGQYKQVSAVARKNPRFKTPKFIFATEQSHHSNRPVETITPLSLALGLSINSSFPDSAAGIQGLVTTLQGPKYAQQIVLTCWHHGTIPKLAKALGVSNPPKWKGTIFDLLWEIKFSSKGKAALRVHHQELLFGDAK